MKAVVPAVFHDLVLADPLFAAEGMDIDNAKDALDRLESALAVLESEYAGRSFFRKLFFIKYPLYRYAVPMSFLRGFLDSERQRRAYLDDPSSERAMILVQSWEKAAQSLTGDVARYRALHRILVRLESDERRFLTQDMFGYMIPYRHLEKMLDQFEKNAEVLWGQVRDRHRLLAQGIPIPSAQNATRLRNNVPLPQITKCTMTPWQETFQSAAVCGGTWPFRYGDITETQGPFRYKLENFDGKPTERTFMFYVLRDKNSSRKSAWVALVDHFYFYDIWHYQPKQDGITRGRYASAVGMTQEEIPYFHEPATILYNSRDATYWMDITTAIDVERRPELNRTSIAVQRSSMFDMILQECARDAQSMTAQLRRRARSDIQDSFSKFHDMLMRSFPGVYYLPFNGSVWRLSEKPSLLGERFVPPNPPKSISDERIRREFTPEMLTTVMNAGRLREERARAAGWLP